MLKKLLKSGLAKSYADAGKMLGLSRERIRQIAMKEGIDIKKLKQQNPDKYSKLKIFICRFCGKKFNAKRNRSFCSRKCFIGQIHRN